jgi:hypothetical protein
MPRAESFTPQERTAALEGVRRLPRNLRSAVAPLTEEQLATPYRPGGWTVRQLVHHVADSHMNAYIRIRLGLTEDWPTIVPYQEHLWAKLEDAEKAPITISLNLLDALHLRWAQLFSSLQENDWKRGYMHPDRSRSNRRSSSTTGTAATTRPTSPNWRNAWAGRHLRDVRFAWSRSPREPGSLTRAILR